MNTKHSSSIILVLLVFAISTAASAQGNGGLQSFITATFANKNVYKTKLNIPVTKAYENNNAVVQTGTAADNFTIVPRVGGYIRYKVILDEGDFKYIKVLPGCDLLPNNQILIAANDASNPEDIVFKVSKKVLEPNTHYLASSALIGKVITLPVRVRKEHWNDNKTTLQGALSLGMGFGWKFKLGNNPYRTHYLNVIAYGAGISQQKYFNITASKLTNKDSVGAKTDEIAVTYFSQGISYEYDRFNIGLFWGKDKMFGSLTNWAYQDRWWWGIGFGYELFK